VGESYFGDFLGLCHFPQRRVLGRVRKVFAFYAELREVKPGVFAGAPRWHMHVSIITRDRS
jgi:uncharacterized cupin superfamily protein